MENDSAAFHRLITVATTLVEYVLESQEIQYSFKMTLASLCFAFACLNTRAPFGVAAVAWRGAARVAKSIRGKRSCYLALLATTAQWLACLLQKTREKVDSISKCSLPLKYILYIEKVHTYCT